MIALRRVLSPVALIGLVVAVACSSAEDGSSELSGGAGDPDAGDGGGGAAAGEGGLDFGSGGGSGEDDICEETTQTAELKPLDMIVVLDRSGSMGTKWSASVNALTTFVTDPDSAGVSVAMNFYPDASVSSGDTCDPSLYDPPHVPMSELPGEAVVITTAMAGQVASGPNTPTYGALYGTFEWAVDHQDDNPDRTVVVVLASDGQPNSCPNPQNDKSEIAGLAAAAYNYNSVATYVIGIDGLSQQAWDTLNEIAFQGGTGQAFDVTTNIDAFADKMMEIREQALGCEYLIPEPGEGSEEFEPTKVNVEYTPGGGFPLDLPQAAHLSDCGGAPGWYYDDPISPTKVILCPASCAVVQSDGEASVALKFGCPTKMN